MSTIIDLARVTAKTTLGRSTVYAYMKAGKFPAPVQVSARRVGWVESEVDAWVEARVESREAKPAEGGE